MRPLIFVLLCLFMQSQLCDGAPTNAQSKCADLVYKWLTDFVKTDQILQVLTTIHEGIYNQLPTADIVDSVYDKVTNIVNSAQAAIAIGAYAKLRSDLGDNYDQVSAKLWAALNSVLGEVFDELKAFSKKSQDEGNLSKAEVINKQYKKLNKIIHDKVKKAFNKSSKAVDAKYWKMIVNDFGAILNFDQYTD